MNKNINKNKPKKSTGRDEQTNKKQKNKHIKKKTPGSVTIEFQS
jgi:hypothetical protein